MLGRATCPGWRARPPLRPARRRPDGRPQCAPGSRWAPRPRLAASDRDSRLHRPGVKAGPDKPPVEPYRSLLVAALEGQQPMSTSSKSMKSWGFNTSRCTQNTRRARWGCGGSQAADHHQPSRGGSRPDADPKRRQQAARSSVANPLACSTAIAATNSADTRPASRNRAPPGPVRLPRSGCRPPPAPTRAVVGAARSVRGLGAGSTAMPHLRSVAVDRSQYHPVSRFFPHQLRRHVCGQWRCEPDTGNSPSVPRWLSGGCEPVGAIADPDRPDPPPGRHIEQHHAPVGVVRHRGQLADQGEMVRRASHR
jgi:hypothetical protein